MYNSKRAKKKQLQYDKFVCPHKKYKDQYTGRYYQPPFPCKSQWCRDHWRKYVRQKMYKLRRSYQAEAHYYAVTLPYPKGMNKSKWKKAIEKWVLKLRDVPGAVSYFWVRHNDNGQENYHMIVRSDIPLDPEGIRHTFWKLLKPAERRKVSYREVYAEAMRDYFDYCWYILTRDKKEKPLDPPWAGLKGTVTQASRNFYPKEAKP